MKIDFRTKETRLITFYLFISALMILNLCLFVSARMSLAGYWSDRILFWIWVLQLLLLSFFAGKNFLRKSISGYL